MKNSRTPALFISFIILAALAGSTSVLATKSSRLMLFQHGTPEVPGGHAFAIMNPFRDRRPEEVAEQLIAELRTGRCAEILRDFHSDDFRICPVMRDGGTARLIWRQDGSATRVVVYDLPKSKSRLWITSSRDEVGFVVSHVSLIR